MTNAMKPAEIRPSTPSTRERRLVGMLLPNAPTVAPQSDRIRHQSRIDPSWFPQVPVIR